MSDNKPTIKDDSAFLRRVDSILKQREVIVAAATVLQSELDAVRANHANLEKKRTALALKESEAEVYAKANAESLFGEGSKVETKVAVVELAKCPPSVVVSNKTRTVDEVIAALRADDDTEDFVAIKFALDKTALKKELQKPGSDLAPKIKKAGLKLDTSKMRFAIKAKKPA